MVLNLAGKLRHTVQPRAALVGLVAGFAAVLGVWVPSFFDATILAWPWFALLGASTTVGVALLTDRLSRPHVAPLARR